MEVMVYALPRNRSRDKLELVADLTSSIQNHFKQSAEWEVRMIQLRAERPDLFLGERFGA